MEEYLVSILVPIYGVEKYIERCSRSLLEQTYRNIEYIFINDCSTDDSIAILQNVLNDYPERQKQVRIINHKNNRGLAAARNSAVLAANGEFIMHVDSDDFIERNTIEVMINEQKKTGADIVTCGYTEIAPKTTRKFKPIHVPIENLFDKILKREIPLFIWGRLIRTSLYKENKIKVKEGANMGEDYQAMVPLSFFAQDITYIDSELYHYNCLNENSYTAKFKRDTALQGWESFYCVKRFIEKHNPKKMDEYHIAELKKIYSDIKGSTMRPNKENREYYLCMRKKLKQTDKKSWKYLPIKVRFIFYIDNYIILHYLLSGFAYLKHKC